jgi:serine/threonine-protein kinase RsbW
MKLPPGFSFFKTIHAADERILISVDTLAAFPYDGGVLHGNLWVSSPAGGIQVWLESNLKATGEGREMAKNLTSPMIKIALPNTIGYERVAMASVSSFARLHGFQADRIEDLKTVVSEAAINAMQHGNRGLQDAEVNIVFTYREEAIRVAVMDEGDGIKNTPSKPDIDRIMNNLDPPIGFGVYLIRELADEVEFNIETDKGHGLRMVIRK